MALAPQKGAVYSFFVGKIAEVFLAKSQMRIAMVKIGNRRRTPKIMPQQSGS
jgi:hypothetical protein